MANIFPKLVQMTDELPQHKDNVRLSVLFSGPDSRALIWWGLGTRDTEECELGPGELLLNTESCPASEKYRDFEKNIKIYFVC